MGYTDFMHLMPQQFNAVLEKHFEKTNAAFRDNWERTRWLAVWVIQPHSKSVIKPDDLMKFSWDAENKPKVIKEPSSRERFEQTVHKFEQWETLTR